MGLLDDIMSGQSGASPWGALYQAPASSFSSPDEIAKRQAELDQANLLRGLMENPAEGVGNPNAGGPSAIVNPTPSAPASPFGAVPQVAPQGPQAPVNPFGAVPQGAPQPSGLMTGGAAPFGFAGPSTIAPAAMMASPPPAAPAPAPVPASPGPAAAPAPSAPDQATPIGVGNYQMPRVGAADDFEPDDAAIPAKAQPTQGNGALGAPAPQGTPAPFSLAGNIGDRLSKSGAGFVGNLDKGPVGALIAGLGSLATNRNSDPTAVAGEKFNATAQALVAKGAPVADIVAAKDNPALMTALIGQYYGKDKFKVQQTGEDAFGGKTFQLFNEQDGTFKPIPAGADGGAGAGGGALAPGVTKIDSSLTGEDYLKQFSPEMQAAVHNYADGKSTPTGNPRKGFTQAVKMVAQKYGADTGQSIDDTTYGARRTMRNQLSSSAPASLGGQINIGNTAAGHLADLSQKALELGNYDTGIAPLSAAVNGIRGLGTEQAAKMEALKGAAQHYGQEITKFYAGSPGGTAERDRFIESVNGARSPKELAAILSTEGELMHSRLDALGGQIKGVLGEEGAKEYPVLRADGQAGLAKVEANVARLRGGGAPAAAPGAITEGQTATNPQTGKTLTFRGGKWQ